MTRQKEITGHGSIRELRTILSSLSAKRVFLVSDKQSHEACGAKEALQWLSSCCAVVEFSEFEPNPRIEDVQRGITAFRQENVDCVLAVGGGSVIDMAKLVNFFSCKGLDPRTLARQEQIATQEGKLLIAVPTTSGTGSEATHFAVLYKGKEKLSIAHETILPDVAIVDPALSMSLPPYTTAASGMDALSQAIESYWSIHSTENSKEFSKRAIAWILPNIVVATREPTPAARLAMAEAAHLAGKAINITKTTAPHAISYPITSYFGIAHGHAVALTLPSILEYNGAVAREDVLDPRGASYARGTIMEIVEQLGAKDIASARGQLEHLMDRIGLERRLSALGIKSEEDIDLIIRNGFNPERVRNNPRLLTKTALREILHGAG
jgi:alcohol dehydrogenase class IV